MITKACRTSTSSSDLETLDRRYRRAEEWRPVQGFVGTYAVSRLGRIMRLAGTPRTRKNRYLKPFEHPDGYACVDLYLDGRRTRRYVHDVVAQAFLGDRPDGHVVHHRDGRKKHNAVANLSYVTWGENERFAYRAGTKPVVRHVGNANPNAKLSSPQVAEIRGRLAAGEIGARIASDLGVTRQLISQIRSGRRWAQVG